MEPTTNEQQTEREREREREKTYTNQPSTGTAKPLRCNEGVPQ